MSEYIFIVLWIIAVAVVIGRVLVALTGILVAGLLGSRTDHQGDN